MTIRVKYMNENDRYYKRMIRDAKAKDLKYNRYNEQDHVDSPFLEKLHNSQQSLCIYCHSMMDWIVRNKGNGMTLERINNDIGHVKSNCVLACHHCNSMKRSYEKRLLAKYFYRWYHNVFDIAPPNYNRRCSFI